MSPFSTCSLSREGQLPYVYMMLSLQSFLVSRSVIGVAHPRWRWGSQIPAKRRKDVTSPERRAGEKQGICSSCRKKRSEQKGGEERYGGPRQGAPLLNEAIGHGGRRR